MSVSYAVDFASLLLLGPHETMLVAAGSAFSQCHLNSKERNPLHRTLFSIASLVITVQGAGLAFQLLGGAGVGDAVDRDGAAAGRRGDGLLPAQHRPGRDGDRAVDARRRSSTTWHNNFLWSAPSYFVGAGTAALAACVRRRTPATGWRR